MSLSPDELIAQSNMTLDEKMAAFERLFPTPLPEAVQLAPVRVTRKARLGEVGACSCGDCWECDVRDFRRRADIKRRAA